MGTMGTLSEHSGSETMLSGRAGAEISCREWAADEIGWEYVTETIGWEFEVEGMGRGLEIDVREDAW